MRERTLRWLDAQLRQVGSQAVMVPPPGGSWLRSLRVALGISSAQLAMRVGVSDNAVASAEHAERDGSISVRTMRRYAAGLDCDLIYVLRPRGASLRAVLEDRAEALYRARFGHREIHPQEIRLVRHWILSKNLSWLWDEAARAPDYGYAVLPGDSLRP